MQNIYDLIVIGGGSGGIALANRAASYGAKVALVEAGRLGGTCVNVGCVPKKIMWNAAFIAHVFHEARRLRLLGAPTSASSGGRSRRAATTTSRGSTAVYQAGLEKYGVEWVRGRARFDGPRSVVVGGARLAAPHVAIATGGRPIVPKWKGAELGITSDGFFELPQQPGRVAIVGAGYVAVELAGVFRALGSRGRAARAARRRADELRRDAARGGDARDGGRRHRDPYPYARAGSGARSAAGSHFSCVDGSRASRGSIASCGRSGASRM